MSYVGVNLGFSTADAEAEDGSDMKRLLLPAVLISLLLVATGGCAGTKRYEVDLSQVKDFEWNGKLRVTIGDHGLFSGWQPEYVELFADNGTAVSVKTRHSEPEIYLIGDRHRFGPATIIVRRTGTPWWPRKPESHVKLFWPRADLAGCVDTCEPHQDKNK